MATSEERMRILKMIQDGRITAEDGARLLSTLTTTSRATFVSSNLTSNTGSGPGRHLRVRVTDLTNGRPRVNIRLPMTLVEVALKMGARFGMAPEELQAKDVMELLRSNTIGPVIDVTNEDGREHVEIMIE